MNVYVRYDQEKSKIVFIVNDSGIGIKQEEKDQIFSILSQLPKNQQAKVMLNNGGTQMGIGLFISK